MPQDRLVFTVNQKSGNKMESLLLRTACCDRVTSIITVPERWNGDREQQTWSDREIRTVLTRLYGVPLSYQIVVEFEEMIRNCSSRNLASADSAGVVTPLYERYSDSNLPLVSKGLIEGCAEVADVLLELLGSVSKYQYEMVKENQQEAVFKMLTSNLSHVIGGLDVIRSNPKKFVCLNNNMEGGANHSKENDLVMAVLQDFYLSLFPLKSSFELDPQYRNRFLYMNDLRRWRYEKRRTQTLLILVFLGIGLTVVCVSFQAEMRWMWLKLMKWRFTLKFSEPSSSRSTAGVSPRTISHI